MDTLRYLSLDLIDQIEMSDFRDEHGHPLFHNVAFVNLRNFIHARDNFPHTYAEIELMEMGYV